jgi:hypothetical protein
MRWATAHVQHKGFWARVGIGSTIEVMRDENRDPAPISLNKKAGRARNNMTDSADQSLNRGRG